MYEPQPMTMTETELDCGYLVWAQPDANQADSMANYLIRHGCDAFAASNEVTIPILTIDSAMLAFQLKAYWKLFWQHSDAELYGLPQYVKPACKDHVE